MNAHLIIDGTINIKSLVKPSLIVDFAIKFVRKSLHPGVFEEVLYRGLLISGLEGFGLKDEHTNIIQAIIFGITHVISFGNVPSIFILHTASQIILGYVIGKVYFKTKSLTPCILLHGLVDVFS
jgi:membrane protease YdiL (CAAX protease family)